MNFELIVFFVLALIAIATALGMLFSRNAIYAALFLVLNFATVAIFYLLLDAPFIALSQVTVYAGAIMVLFLFVIMLLGAERHPVREEILPWQRPVAMGLGVILVLQAGYLLFKKMGAAALVSTETGTQLSDPSVMSTMLFKEYLLPFEVTSILLLVAMIGAIVLTKQERRTEHGEGKKEAQG
jgi:NADH-quinone oxidoreductase subunit J